MLQQADVQPAAAARPVAIRVPIVERAFELAATGAFHDPGKIAERLESEGYLDVQEHIRDSPLLRRQLREAGREAQRLVSRTTTA